LETNCGKCGCADLNSDEDVDFADLAIFAYHGLERPHQRVVSISPLGTPGREHPTTLGFERSKCVKYVVTTIALNLEVRKDDLIMASWRWHVIKAL